MPGTVFSLGAISSAHLSAGALQDPQLPGVLSTSSGQTGSGDTLLCGRGYDSATCLGVRKPGSRASKTPSLRIQTGKHAFHEFPGQSAPLTWFCR